MKTIPVVILVCAALGASALGSFAVQQFLVPTPSTVPPLVAADLAAFAEHLDEAEADAGRLRDRVVHLQEALAEARDELREHGAAAPMVVHSEAVPGVTAPNTSAAPGNDLPAVGTPDFQAEVERLYGEFQARQRRERREQESQRWRTMREDHGRAVVSNLQEKLGLNASQKQTVENLIAARNQRVDLLTAQRQEAQDRGEEFDMWPAYNQSTKTLTDAIRAELSSQQQAGYDDMLKRGGYRALSGQNRWNRQR